jgi:hypothetical protein
MDTSPPALIWRTVDAPTWSTPTQQVTPVAWLCGLRFAHGLWLWQIPVAVKVMQNDQTTTLPILDLTRIILWCFYTLTSLSLLLVALIYLNRRKPA